MFHYGKQLEPNQREALPGQVENQAGGFSFAVDDWVRLDRFLILGTEGGSYYADARKMTQESAAAVQRCIASDGPRVVARIVEISDAGRAPKSDPALFALALAAKRGDEPTRKAAFAALPKVARIGTHLFHFAEHIKSLGGWGRGTKAAFANWYRNMPDDRLALQAIKYQQRDGWSHRDILRKSHPSPRNDRQKAIFHWMVKGWESIGLEPHPDEVLARIWAFERAKIASAKELVRLIEQYGLPHECVPNGAKSDPRVWGALLPQMGLGALVRNLGKMTSVGLIGPLSKSAKLVRERVTDVDEIKRARLHPLQLLVALKTYAQGHGEKGKLTWSPEQRVCDALDEAFYLAFRAVGPTGKRHLLALDVSGSMFGGEIAGMAGISPAVGAAAMALVTANVEQDHAMVAFTAGDLPSKWGPRTTGISSIEVSPRVRLDAVVATMRQMAGKAGGTDCALPMVWAAKNRVPVDVFCTYTDSETWAGKVHPTRALQDYRQKMGIPAKLVTIGMVANEFTIADPNDAGQLDVVGFDTSTPSLLADFAR